ncbi:MAG: hemerythrin domain-containing protein [Nitrospira sp.]
MPKRATAAKKESKQPRTSDALHMLKQDHQQVARLFKECIAAVPERREKLARQIFQELEIHSALEEELFYPALEQEMGESTPVEATPQRVNGTALLLYEEESDAEEELDEDEDEDKSSDEDQEDAITTAYEDHREMKQMIEQLRTMNATEDQFQEMLAELQSMVLYHIDEEEEVMFPEARLTLDIELLGRQMHERKQELLASM